jgi:hypothetical protein
MHKGAFTITVKDTEAPRLMNRLQIYIFIGLGWSKTEQMGTMMEQRMRAFLRALTNFTFEFNEVKKRNKSKRITKERKK